MRVTGLSEFGTAVLETMPEGSVNRPDLRHVNDENVRDQGHRLHAHIRVRTHVMLCKHSYPHYSSLLKHNVCAHFELCESGAHSVSQTLSTRKTVGAVRLVRWHGGRAEGPTYSSSSSGWRPFLSNRRLQRT